MIKSEIHHGRIYAGTTQLACTIRIEQTAPMRLTVRAGTFTSTSGRKLTLATDAVFDLAADATYPTECRIEIGDIAGTPNIWCGTRRVDSIEEINPPIGWNTGHLLVFPFVIPPGTIKLDNVDIFILEVLPGFPEPEQMAAMGIERGTDGSMRMMGRTK